MLERLKHGEDARSRVLIEADDCLVTLPEGGFNLVGRAIATTDPNHFGGIRFALLGHLPAALKTPRPTASAVGRENIELIMESNGARHHDRRHQRSGRHD